MLNQKLEAKDQQIAAMQKELEVMILKYLVRAKVQTTAEVPFIDGFAELFSDAAAESEAALKAREEEEQAIPDALTGDSKDAEEQGGKSPTKPGSRQTRIIPAHLERKVVERLDLPEEDRIDHITGKELPIIDIEKIEKIDIIPCRIIVNITERVIRSIPGAKRSVEVPELPEIALPKCRFDNGFVADMLVQRFLDHKPFYRQEKAWERQGIHAPSSTLDGIYIRVTMDWFKDLADLLPEVIFSGGYVGFDDTPVKMQVKGTGELQKVRLWVCRAGTGPPLVFFKYSETKEKEEATALLQGFTGYAQADAYAGHDQVMKYDHITEVGCMAHAIRKFKNAHPLYPQTVMPILKLFRKLYDIEDEIRDKDVDTRTAMRQNRSRLVIDAIIARVNEAKLTALPKDDLSTALNYFLNQQGPLTEFLKDGRLMIDNNEVERCFRAVGIGRKNWGCFGNKTGAEAAAIMMSLIYSCRNLRINAWLYLKDLLDRLPTHPKDKLRELLPDVWQPLSANADLGVPVKLDIEEKPYRPI
jgi:transposase